MGTTGNNWPNPVEYGWYSQKCALRYGFSVYWKFGSDAMCNVTHMTRDPTYHNAVWDDIRPVGRLGQWHSREPGYNTIVRDSGELCVQDETSHCVFSTIMFQSQLERYELIVREETIQFIEKFIIESQRKSEIGFIKIFLRTIDVCLFRGHTCTTHLICKVKKVNKTPNPTSDRTINPFIEY